MSLPALGVNGLWTALCLPEAFRFNRATRHVEAAQRQVLARLLHENSRTRFGREHRFDAIRSAEDYRASVPLSDFDISRPAIEAVMQGGQGILTAEQPLRLVPTSGSTAAGKLIPYTPALRREFQKGIAPWIVAQYLRHPACLAGKAYWSISPVLPPTQTSSAVPIGFDDDTDYLNPLLRRLLASTMAVPSCVSRIQDMESFRYVTLLFLLKADDLAFVSVWNPTFFSLLLDPLREWGRSLAGDLESGRLSPPGALPTALHESIQALIGRHPKRAAEIRAILASHAPDDDPPYARLWPRLKLISCWTDAAAAGPADDLRRFFPKAIILPKGLLATEGIVSTPVGRPEGAALAVRSHFYEFMEDNDPARSRFAWQLETGRSYAVVLTTGGGLYRYRLGDMVRVTGFLGQCPLLRFTGRCDKISDWYGEKLNESHVGGLVSALLARHSLRAPFAMLAPDGDPRPDHYTLLLADTPGGMPQDLAPLTEELDAALCENIHYAYCRKLGQLKPASVTGLACGSEEAHRRYLRACLAKGQKAGDIKPVSLDSRPGWPKTLTSA